MMTLQDFLLGWPLLWPSPGHQGQGPSLLDKQAPSKPSGAEEMDGWKILGKKLLLHLCVHCLILEPLRHPSVA